MVKAGSTGFSNRNTVAKRKTKRGKSAAREQLLSIFRCAMDKHTPATVLTSVSIYAALIGSTFDPNCRAVFIKAFGESPLGMRTHVFVPTLLTILFIPFPLLAWHLTKLVAHAVQHGRRFSLIILFTYGFEVGKQHPEMRRSQLFCYAIGSYFIGLMAAWIVYASLQGI